MYFKIETIEFDDDFSWIIYKNPVTAFERERKQGTIAAKFLDNGRVYEGWYAVNAERLVKAMKKANMSSYVHFQLSGVCPSNLTAFEETFRSAITGKVSAALDEQRFFAPKKLRATIGPYPDVHEEWFQEVWEAFGITATVVEDDLEAAHMWQFEGEMSVTEFLQKVYLISYFFTEKLRIHYVPGEVIQKFARRCSGWLAQCEDQRIKGKIIKRICRYEPDFVQLFKIEYESLQAPELKDDEPDGKIKSKPVENLEAVLEKKNPSLHERRHDEIVVAVETYMAEYFQAHEDNDDSPRPIILDWGMGDAKLTIKLFDALKKRVKLRGMDANDHRIRKAKRRLPSGDFRVQNLLFPSEHFQPKVLIHCEVIEHMHYLDRLRALKIMRDYYQPELLILTTPNFEHNINWPGLIDDEGQIQYRHGDHKIEYTRAEFENEVVDYLAKDYEIEWRDIIDLSAYEMRTAENENDPDVKSLKAFNQPTFIIVCQRKKAARKISAHHPLTRNYHSLALPVSGLEIYGKELEQGYSDRAVLVNGFNITHLGPTVPPVDFNKDFPEDLEHPMTALQYYLDRGVTDVYIEKKHMGSRATVLVFRTEACAQALGFEQVTVSSRGGFPFFHREDQDTFYEMIRAELVPKLERDSDDFVMLDCEVLPWKYKAARLIQREFQSPGDAALLFRRYTQGANTPAYARAKRFNEVLTWFNQDDTVHAQMFQLLLKGSLKIGRENKVHRLTDVVLGSTLGRSDMYDYLETMTGEFLRFKRGMRINDLHIRMNDPNRASTTEFFDGYWREVTEEDRCEGIVVKPAKFFTQLPSGYWVQPMLKVRGMPYLHLIYGIDIGDPDYFKQLTHRKIKAKRLQAIIQHELADMMLRAFTHNDPYLRQRVVAAFLGNERIKFNDLDKTL